MFTDIFYYWYDDVQQLHYALADRSPVYRFVSLSVFAVTAPVIVALLWFPHVFECYMRELASFYKYLPSGFAGKRRVI